MTVNMGNNILTYNY